MIPSDWLQSQQSGWCVALVATIGHIVQYIRFLKGALMSSPSPIAAAIEADLPALIRGTKAICKALLDTMYTTGSNEDKAAQLTAQLEPGFNQGITQLGLPSWATAMVDGVFAKLVSAAVAAVES